MLNWHPSATIWHPLEGPGMCSKHLYTHCSSWYIFLTLMLDISTVYYNTWCVIWHELRWNLLKWFDFLIGNLSVIWNYSHIKQCFLPSHHYLKHNYLRHISCLFSLLNNWKPKTVLSTKRTEHVSKCTPSEINMESKDHPVEKENHLNQTSMFGFNMLIFQGVSTC